MKNGAADYEVGYGKPPIHTRWRKRQSGNPARKYRRTPKGAIDIIDDLFARKIDLTENGRTRRVTIFEAIVAALSSKELAGNTRAMHARLKYMDFARENSVTDKHPGILIRYSREPAKDLHYEDQ